MNFHTPQLVEQIIDERVETARIHRQARAAVPARPAPRLVRKLTHTTPRTSIARETER